MKILVAGGLSLLLVSSLSGEVIPTNIWVDFYGSATTYNGVPIPVGSIIDAYDPSGVHCGSDTVIFAGNYGFMPVYGDDPYTSGTDEGGETGNLITFTINGRQAVNHGPDVASWDISGTQKEANLVASGTVSMEGVEFPDNKYAAPGDTVRYSISVRNTGQGIDFYTVSAVSSNGWVTRPQFGFSYALPGGTAVIYFDILIPTMIFNDTFDVATFRVSSGIDPTVYVEHPVTTYISTTDAPTSDGGKLPRNFSLYQNYPNPFNPVTTIAFDLPVASPVNLEVFDLLGRQIENINMGYKTPGHYSFEYSGESLSSGIYFYRLRAGNMVDMKKMVLLK